MDDIGFSDGTRNYLKSIFLSTLAEQEDASRKLLQQEDSDAYREAIAKRFPKMAKQIEKMTQAEHRQLLRNEDIAEAVVRTIEAFWKDSQIKP